MIIRNGTTEYQSAPPWWICFDHMIRVMSQYTVHVEKQTMFTLFSLVGPSLLRPSPRSLASSITIYGGIDSP